MTKVMEQISGLPRGVTPLKTESTQAGLNSRFPGVHGRFPAARFPSAEVTTPRPATGR